MVFLRRHLSHDASLVFRLTRGLTFWHLTKASWKNFLDPSRISNRPSAIMESSEERLKADEKEHPHETLFSKKVESAHEAIPQRLENLELNPKVQESAAVS